MRVENGKFGDNDLVLIGGSKGFGQRVPGSTEHKCENCAAKIWVSPGTLDGILDEHLKSKGKIHFLCNECAPIEAYEQFVLTQAQKDEMNGIDELRETAKKRGITLEELLREVAEKLQHAAKMQTEDAVMAVTRDSNDESPKEVFSKTKEGEWSELHRWLKDCVTDLGKRLGPKDDWMPVVFVDATCVPADMPQVDPQIMGKEAMLVIGLPDGMSSEENKDIVAMMMHALAVKTKARGMTFLSTVWVSHIPAPIMGEDLSDETASATAKDEAMAHVKQHGPPSEDPNREEKLMLLSIYYGGENDGTKTILADIVRSDGPPELKNWKLIDDPRTRWMGRFPDALYAGLKEAWEEGV